MIVERLYRCFPFVPRQMSDPLLDPCFLVLLFQNQTLFATVQRFRRAAVFVKQQLGGGAEPPCFKENWKLLARWRMRGARRPAATSAIIIVILTTVGA
jgi:hypothetical protein